MFNNQDDKQIAWKYFIDTIFNDCKEVPIELFYEFKKFTELHKIKHYSNFIRSKMLPSNLLHDSWEKKWLQELSDILPQNVQTLVLKGAAARDLGLYPYPQIRECTDLDIFISFKEGNNYSSRKSFIEFLLSKNLIQLVPNLKLENILKKGEDLTCLHKDNIIDLHFKLYKPLKIFNLSLYNNDLISNENRIIEESIPYSNLPNVRKMNTEDFWFYSIYHFLNSFPVFTQIYSLLDSFLIIKGNSQILSRLEKHAKETNQTFIYRTGLYLLKQLNNNLIDQEININFLAKYVFVINRIKYPNYHSLWNQVLHSIAQGMIFTNGRIFLSSFYSMLNLVTNSFITYSIEDGIFSKYTFSNLKTKILYSLERIRNYTIGSLIKLFPNKKQRNINQVETITTTKKLITLKLEDLKLTFEVPSEYYEHLAEIWHGFLTDEHKEKKISVESVKLQNNNFSNTNVILSNETLYIRFWNNSWGKVSCLGSGFFYANDFWDVRNCALYLLRALAIQREKMLIIHSGGFTFNDETFIFPGGSSTGKTTFLNLMIENNFLGINDDTILLKEENNIWYAYPTPFMSKYQKPLLCEKKKITGIIEIIKVYKGYKIKSINIDSLCALLLTNSMTDLIIDDADFLRSKTAAKIITLSKQIKHSVQISFSLENKDLLFRLFSEYLALPDKEYKSGENFIRLSELRGSSMEPTFNNGEILKVKEVVAHDLKPKDIICFSDPLSTLPIVHRVKYLIRSKGEVTIITQGDNSSFCDSPSILKSHSKILKIIKD